MRISVDKTKNGIELNVKETKRPLTITIKENTAKKLAKDIISVLKCSS
jgi:hypothetical protein